MVVNNIISEVVGKYEALSQHHFTRNKTTSVHRGGWGWWCKNIYVYERQLKTL